MHVGWCWFFVIGLGLGNAGAGYANCVTWWTQCAMATLYLACSAKNAGLRVRSVVWVEAPKGLGVALGWTSRNSHRSRGSGCWLSSGRRRVSLRSRSLSKQLQVAHPLESRPL